MIKIISRPEPKAIRHWRITCRHCNTVFECDDTDFTNEIVGHGERDDTIRCPYCGIRLCAMNMVFGHYMKNIDEERD